MKKKLILLITVFTLLLPFIVNASSKNVKSMDVVLDNGVIKIEGTTDSDVLAVAIMVYDTNEEYLIKYVTTDVDDDNKFGYDIDVSSDDNYVIKAANYDGGDYVVAKVGEVKIESKYNVVAASTSSEDKKAAELTNSLIEKLVDGKKVSGISDELKTKILKAVDEGKDIKVDLVKKTINEDSVKDDASLIKKELSKNTIVAAFLDIDIEVSIDGEVQGNITLLDEKIELSVSVPENLDKVKDGYSRNYSIVRLHDGKVEVLSTKEKDGKLYFETDKFSTYAVTYEDIKNPKTLDNIVKYVILIIIACGGMLGTSLYFKKKIK